MDVARVPRETERVATPDHELRESILLLTLTVSCLGAYVGLGVVFVRLFGGN
jgi:hypothetical protein